jgi:hypothetical protein
VQDAHAAIHIVQSHQHQRNNMGILDNLDNLENAWDENFLFESNPMPVTDNMGRPLIDSSLAVKMFSETCCESCSCKS